MMILAASESNEIWLALIAAAVLLIPAWFNYRATTQAAKDAREDARMIRGNQIADAAKVDQVKEALVSSTNATDGKLETIHKLVNSALGVQLKRVMILSREKANLSRDAGHIAEADADQKAYNAHMLDQPAGT